MNRPGGIYFDKELNRLIVVSFTGVNSPIQAIDLNTGVVSTLAEPNVGDFDDMTMDEWGYYYISGWEGVYRFDHNFSLPPQKIADGSGIMTDVDYNPQEDLLVITHYNWDSIVYVDVTDPDGDNIINELDNCPETYNPEQVDLDDNGIGDACESCCGLYTLGYTGNVDCGDDGKRNLADITRLIDRVYVSKEDLVVKIQGYKKRRQDKPRRRFFMTV